MPKQIVIVTEEMDEHADAIILTLREMGHEPLRLHTADIPFASTLSLNLDGGAWNGVIQLKNKVLDVSDIHSIWWRRPARPPIPEDLSKREAEFVLEQFRHAMRGLWASLECRWMSRPDKIYEASWKMEQLTRAVQFGFNIPPTLVTNDATQVRAFYEEHRGHIIFKVLADPMLGFGTIQETAVQLNKESPEIKSSSEFLDQIQDLSRVVYTTVITNEHLLLIDNTLHRAPGIFQAYVPKRVELRIVVIGDDIFAGEIDSQFHTRTQHDWRRFGVQVPIRKAVLPVDIAERCYAFTKSYGLTFSSMDFIQTPEDQYVFIENNPNGQFLFVDVCVPEFKMREAVANFLTQGMKT